MNQHLVSRVLLRELADGDDRQISGLDLDNRHGHDGDLPVLRN
jgi:hypothetical protein